MYWIHLNSNGFVFKKEIADSEPSTTGEEVISVSEEEFNQIIVGFRYVDGKWIEQSEVLDQGEDPVKLRIQELKQNLRDTDWVVVEILEKQLVNKDPDHSIDDIYNQRQEWRDEIAKLIRAKGEQ
jgi:hypothetical protein